MELNVNISVLALLPVALALVAADSSSTAGARRQVGERPEWAPSRLESAPCWSSR